MLLCLTAIATGIALRQIDRAWFARGRPHAADAAQLIALQRARANNWTPALLLVGQWIQITGWWLLAAHGPLAAAAAAAGVAVHFRHLQEISHFAIHGVLARTPRANLLLAEVFAHRPLGLAPATVRRTRHVRDHHPNATVTGVDPNLEELHQAGLRPGAARRQAAIAFIHPLTWRGIRTTAAGIAANVGHAPGRVAALAAVLAAAYLVGGWPAVICSVLVPRLLLYPQLAHLSLLVEHTWFDPQPRTGTRAWVEAGRCLRLYPHNHALAHLAAITWLPYGDLHHYAHSAHPSLRWNCLRALERHLNEPHFTPTALLLGTNSVAHRHLNALTPAGQPNQWQQASNARA
ncbi:dihydrouridine synthase [Streptantibioticus ferralitis]|uniref:Dihydrouridine synthase n=1 Tax=Streptantibioticus ferralitis TaxID=236510 RepID=A0ABT5ZAN4_9ACTN|nr:dihydrouridine synthase [Streptantibioticus ferralitis]MDF2260903.1 dihydrouridine synthase [Streptantibioticus ferralitis]